MNLQVLLKFAFAHDLQNLATILKYIASQYRINSEGNTRDYLLFVKFAKYTQLIIKIVPIAYLSMAFLFMFTALYESVMMGNMKAPFSLYFPNIYGDLMTSADIPLVVCNLTMFFANALTLTTYDTIIYITFCNVAMLSQIFAGEWQEFQGSLIRGKLNRIQIKRKLLKVIHMQNKYKEIIENLDEGFGRACAIQIATAVLISSITLLVAMKVSNIPAITPFIEYYIRKIMLIIGIRRIFLEPMS